MNGNGELDPAAFVSELSLKLAARSRHVCLFLGAGAGKACGLPDVAGLQDAVLKALKPAQRKALKDLLKGRDLEKALSHLRRVAALLEEDQDLGGLTGKEAQALDAAICSEIVKALDVGGANLDPMRDLARWVAGTETPVPIELFTVNYDLLIESGLEEIGAIYSDGFVGTVRARFRSDIVEGGAHGQDALLPPAFARLWKLHGSVNWAWNSTERTEVIRQGSPVEGKEAAAIYPSDAKYDDARRVPFVVLMDRFRKALSEKETVLLISGYSFGDAHLNEMIFDAAVRNQRSEYIALCYSDIPEAVAERALKTPSLTIAGQREAVTGGVRGKWASDETVDGIWEDKKFRLGDFSALAAFLARRCTSWRTDDDGA